MKFLRNIVILLNQVEAAFDEDKRHKRFLKQKS